MEDPTWRQFYPGACFPQICSASCEVNMQIRFVSPMVENQERALQFYTSMFGFEKMADITIGEYRWLTVKPPDGVNDVELVLDRWLSHRRGPFNERCSTREIRRLPSSRPTSLPNSHALTRAASSFAESRRKWGRSTRSCSKIPMAISSIWCSRRLETSWEDS